MQLFNSVLRILDRAIIGNNIIGKLYPLLIAQLGRHNPFYFRVTQTTTISDTDQLCSMFGGHD